MHTLYVLLFVCVSVLPAITKTLKYVSHCACAMRVTIGNGTQRETSLTQTIRIGLSVKSLLRKNSRERYGLVSRVARSYEAFLCGIIHAQRSRRYSVCPNGFPRFQFHRPPIFYNRGPKTLVPEQETRILIKVTKIKFLFEQN